jgi:hypothetical protein
MARSHFTTTREPQAAHDNLPHKIFLFYSNRRPEDAAFLDELMEIQERNPNYTFTAR